MKVEHCVFPDDLLYEPSGHTWVRLGPDSAEIGVTSLLANLAGKLLSLRLRAPGIRVAATRSLGTIEGPHYVGPIPSPVSGTILESNLRAQRSPKLVNDDPYGAGWVARVRLNASARDPARLRRVGEVVDQARATIREHRIRCFSIMPDHEMVEIGVECRAVLKHLDELIEKGPVGVAIHLVVDDPTAYLEMMRWTDQTHHELVDWRREGELYHFVVRKTR